MAVSSTTVFRVRGLPCNLSAEHIRGIIERSLGTPSEVSGLSITSLAEDFYHSTEQVATLNFRKSLPELFIAAAASNEWPVELIDADYDPTISRSRTLNFDTHYRGVTALNNPVDHKEAVDCVVVCGLGGHAFGSFKEKGTSYMWLRDTLPKDLPNLRILLYGYESGLAGSESSQNITGIAETFIGHLRELRSQFETIPRPLIMIAHSLGGLIVKQAIIMLSRGGEPDKRQVQSIIGLLFFGVPNRGMDIESLRAMVGNQPNRYILESVGQYSDLLVDQDVRFGLDFHYVDSPIYSFYETKTSPTALKIDGSWKMVGDQKLLVGPFSAKRPRPWEPELHHEAFDRTHSDLVKFSIGDVYYDRVHSRLSEITNKAKTTSISRYLSQESTERLSSDEEACLRTLAFTEMHFREGRVESAALDTGDWLLQTQDFQDWAQRKRLNEHRGFFWIQGNPGSGKSTLMKKAYSHIQSLSRDPTSVIAQFYFNARGSETEKSPAGLFRTLLHTLCQHISALRAQVMKLYHTKCRLLNSSWEWQHHELAELLSSVVSLSVLGQRNLVLCVDALDECDLIGAKSVIQFFENLASSSIRENTKFSICLSSRYWPQLTIRQCFKARVELENHGDISSYIQQHMETMQADSNENSQLAALGTKLRNKANGTFLWVILVVQELLSEHENGATLGELDRILHKVPPDLSKFYQHQMESTESTGYDDRPQMLSILQCVFYSLKPLSPKELQYLLAFGGHEEWAHSNEYAMSDARMEKRIREKSKGLIEIAELPEMYNALKDVLEPKRIVQFIHQSVKDFLSRDGFKSLRKHKKPNDAASGHDFLKVACFNYLKNKDLKNIPIIDFRFYSDNGVRQKLPTLSEDHPLLEYAVDHLFPHAALAERHGVPQDSLRSHMSNNIQGSFERWKYLNDLISIQRRIKSLSEYMSKFEGYGVQGPEARPLHIFSQYGLLETGLMKLEEDPNIRGGLYDYPLLAAAAGGHKDVVRCLLDSGADPQTFSLAGETAYNLAAASGHVDVLRLLLDHPTSVITLQQRIEIAKNAQEMTFYNSVENSVSARQAHEILALLIPEDSIPTSAMDDTIWSSHDPYVKYAPFFALLLDKCEIEYLTSENTVCWFIANCSVGLSLIRRLLDRIGSIEISEKVLTALHFRGYYSGDSNARKIALILFECRDEEVTERFVDVLYSLRDSSWLFHQLIAAGFELPPPTCDQVMSVLSNGNPESVGFFIQRAPDNAESDRMLLAAVQNHRYGAHVVRILLGLRKIDSICEATLISSLQCPMDDDSKLSLIHTFEDRWGTLKFSRDALVATLFGCGLEVFKFALSRCERFSVTEDHIFAALRGNQLYIDQKLDLLLGYDPAFYVRDELVAETVAAGFRRPCLKCLKIYFRHGKSLLLTESVVRAAAHNVLSGTEALEIILQHDSNAKISNTMFLEALLSPCGATLITLMLESDPSIVMQEEFLMAAASNAAKGALIFEALYQKGRISICNSNFRAPHAHPAKRQRISSDLSPPPRRKVNNSIEITQKVIEAAASNDNENQREQILSLFQTWGVLTEEDRGLLGISNALSRRSTSSSSAVTAFVDAN